MKPSKKPASSAALPPIEVDASKLAPLGMTPQLFLRRYWQKRPLLIRNAFPDFVSPIEPGDLAGLACEEAALSRLITYDRARDGWSVRSGPFQEDEFPGMPDHDWTLLVQDVDKWDPDIAALLEAFDFLPRWRIDDIMVSFAATGGSVGAHVDQYDVFLLQAHGHRRWQIDAGPKPPLGFRDDVELKLLREFTPTHEWVLGPGDMLYLPPGVPHHGVAEDPCLTFSVGMRAPSSAELIADYLDALVADADESTRYQDRDLAPPADPNEIDAVAMGRVVEALNTLRMNDPDRLGEWFGRFITTYRSAGEAAVPEVAPSLIEVEVALDQGGLLQRHPMTRMAWRRAAKGAVLFASGQALPMNLRDARLLAAVGELDGALYQTLGEQGRQAVLALVTSGHYVLPGTDEDDDDYDD
ncbi:50S ribosomal protein L16 3-hydroxylase [Pseudoxanthomonas sp. GM95]|uniref:cupin domain-containing protein n=1 Tax=Pseudoxanthomonas sp. GM95 TaxID=1881043 RepID=UPI0008BEC887|nr:cupin domain-containing protein [Pseudoxanthomonas sp. GM95]SEL89679.1 50S ribosomal protein L16 3-hydroxylase [Pseudoxanthomonas sp. GM95]